MKHVVLFFAMMMMTIISFGQSQTWVSGYINANGQYIQSHWRQNPDKTNHNNWSTVQQINPYTNDQGTKAKDYSPQANNYGQGKTIFIGPKGGQYYYNNNGNKVYVPKRR